MEVKITNENYESYKNGSLPLVIDFWATWCGPCRALAPTVEQIAQEYAGRVVVAKCNVDECSDAPVNYGIRSIPTLIYFKNGEVAERSVGAVAKSKIAQTLDSLL